MFKKYKALLLPVMSGIALSIGYIAINISKIKNTPQVYYDIISSLVSIFNTNKTLELNIFWRALFIGVFTTLIINYFLIKKEAKKDFFIGNNTDIVQSLIIYIGIIPFFLIAILLNDINYILGISSISLFVAHTFYKWSNEKLIHFLLLDVFTYFCFISFAILINLIFHFSGIVGSYLFFISSFVSLFLVNTYDEKIIKRIIVYLQFTFPLLLLNFLNSKYNYKETDITVLFPKGYYIFFISIILVLYLYMFFYYKKYLNGNTKINIDKYIFITTVICLFVLNAYNSPIMSFTNRHVNDFWHTGEMVLPWNQIVDLGMTPYKEFFPPSGLHPLIFGFFHNILLDSKILSYNAAYATMMVFFSIIIAILTYYNFNSYMGLFLSLIINFPVFRNAFYNRIFFILITFLILSLPKLIKSRGFWLDTWLLMGILSFLYYPIHGVATVLGTLPFALIQLYLWIKSKRIYKEIKNKCFIGLTLMILIFLTFIIPLLYRMLEHIFRLSKQNVLAEGISAFGVSVPQDWFLHFFNNIFPVVSSIKLQDSYSLFIFTLLILALLIPVCTIENMLISNLGNLKKIIISRRFLVITFIIISLPITYIYSLVRIDSTYFLSRNEPNMVVIIGFGLSLFCYLSFKRIKINLINISSIAGIGIIFVFLAMINGLELGKEKHHIRNSFYIPPEYTYIKKNADNKFGVGFSEPNALQLLSDEKLINSDFIVNPKDSFVLGSTLSYFYLNKKTHIADSGLSIVTDKNSQRLDVKMLNENPPVYVAATPFGTGSSFTLRNYYLYFWLIKNGYILYKGDKYTYFINSIKYKSLFYKNGDNINFIKENPEAALLTLNIYNTANAWGNSIDSLKKCMIENKTIDLTHCKVSYHYVNDSDDKLRVINQPDANIELIFDYPISGMNADFLYIDMELDNKNNTKIPLSVYWRSEEFNNYLLERRLDFTYNHGKLLIPLGCNPSWLLGNNVAITLYLGKLPIGTELKIKDIKLYKLNTDYDFTNEKTGNRNYVKNLFLKLCPINTKRYKVISKIFHIFF